MAKETATKKSTANRLPATAKKNSVDKGRKTESVQNGQQLLRGRVVSAKLPQTVTVLIERRKVHPFYKKAFVRSKKYLVQDEIGAKEGDLVEICKIRPISKNKHWSIVKVVGRDMEAIITTQLKEKAEEAIAEVMPVEEEEVESTEEQTQNQKQEIEERIEKKKRSNKRGGGRAG